MDVGEGSRTDPEGRAASGTSDETSSTRDETSTNPDEDVLLDEAMRQADERLVASLQRDELRRRRRRWWALGGFAMIVSIAGIVASVLYSGSGVEPSARTAARPTTSAANVRPTKAKPGAKPLDPAKARILSAAGWRLWNAQKFEEAAAKFEAALELDPNLTAAWNGLGWSRFNYGDRLGAEEAFNEVVKRSPNHPGAKNGLGYLHFYRRHYEDAEKHWLAVADQASASWYGLAKMYLLQGKYAEAQKWAAKAASDQPKDDVAKQMLAAAKAKKLAPDLRKMIEPSEREYEIGPGDVVVISIHELIRAGSITLETRKVTKLGNVNLPIIGMINLDRLTVQEAEQRIKSKLRDKKLLSDPVVNVVVREKRRQTPSANRSSRTPATPLRTSASGSTGLNDSFEQGKRTPTGWRQGANVPGVTYIWDKKTAFDGKASLCLKKTANRYFPIAQWSRTMAHDGTATKLNIAAQVKAKRAMKAIIDAQFLGSGGKHLGHEWAVYIGAKKRGDPPADHDWKQYSATISVPKGTERIVIGLQIYGPGTVWFDKLIVKRAER